MKISRGSHPKFHGQIQQTCDLHQEWWLDMRVHQHGCLVGLAWILQIHPSTIFFWRNRVQYPLASWHQHSLSAWKPPHVWTPTFASAAMKPFGIARPSSLAWAKGGTSGPFVRPSGFRGRDSLKGWYVKPYKNEGWPSPNMGFWTLFIYIYIHIYIE